MAARGCPLGRRCATSEGERTNRADGCVQDETLSFLPKNDEEWYASKGKPSHALLVCQLLCVQCFGTLWKSYLPLVGRPYTLVVCAHPLAGSAIDSREVILLRGGLTQDQRAVVLHFHANNNPRRGVRYSQLQPLACCSRYTKFQDVCKKRCGAGGVGAVA
jgi:hypothetical protein